MVSLDARKLACAEVVRVKASDLRDRVLFQQPNGTAGRFGIAEDSWTAGPEMRAHFQYLKFGEVVMQARMAGRETIVVSVRANAVTRTIDGSWRMRDQRTLKFYNVKGAKELDDRLWIEVLVEGGSVVA